jgi:fructose-bisphosphate aldolase, class II
MGRKLRDVLSETQEKGFAVGYFNVSDFAILKAVVDAARDMQTDVIVGASEGHRPILPWRRQSSLDMAHRHREFAFLLSLYSGSLALVVLGHGGGLRHILLNLPHMRVKVKPVSGCVRLHRRADASTDHAGAAFL